VAVAFLVCLVVLFILRARCNREASGDDASPMHTSATFGAGNSVYGVVNIGTDEGVLIHSQSEYASVGDMSSSVAYGMAPRRELSSVNNEYEAPETTLAY